MAPLVVAAKEFRFAPKTLHLEWDPILDVDVRKLVEKAPNLEQLEVLESTSKSLLPALIQKDGGQDCLDRMVHLAKVLQLGLEYQGELGERNASRLELELDNLQQDLRRAQTGDSEALVGKLEGEIEDLNADLREAYKKMDAYEAELDDLRDELAQRATEGRGRAGAGGDSNVLRREMEEERAKSSRLERQVEFLEGALDHERQRNERIESETREEKRSAAILREKAKQLDDEVGELRTQLEAEQKRMEMREMDDRGQSSRLQQKNREIDRLQRENKVLERQFVEVQAKGEELAAEMLQLSEQVVRLDETQRERDATIADMEAVAADAEREKGELLAQVAELRGVAAEKMALLDEFEKRFAEQYREWEGRAAELAEEVKAREDEAAALREELERWHRDAAGGAVLTSQGGDGEGKAGALQQALRAAQEKEALLLEAYEQLERDQEKELAAALARQKAQLTKLESHNRAKEAALEADRQRYDQLDRALAEAQIEKEEALSRLADYEAGVYGLSEAMRDVKRLKKSVKAGEEELQACLTKLNHRNQQMEDLLEENRFLRQKAGVPAAAAVDLGDFRLQSQVEVEQLRALNAQLEKELAQLEDERRELKNELRYRAKYHGEAAAKMGLTAKQLVALEEYSNKLRFGKDKGGSRSGFGKTKSGGAGKGGFERSGFGATDGSGFGSETEESESDASGVGRARGAAAKAPGGIGFEMEVRTLRTKLSLADVQSAELRETVEHLKEENTTLMKENLLLKDRVISALSKAAGSAKKLAGDRSATTGADTARKEKSKQADDRHVASNQEGHAAVEEELAGILRLLRQEVTWQSGQLVSSPTKGAALPDGVNALPDGVNAPRSEYERTLRERLNRLMDDVSEKEVEAEEARARAQRAERERDAFRARLRERVEGQLSPPARGGARADVSGVSSEVSLKFDDVVGQVDDASRKLGDAGGRSTAASPGREKQIGDQKDEPRREEVAFASTQRDEIVRELQIKEDQLALLTADFEAQRAELERAKDARVALEKAAKKAAAESASERTRAEKELQDARAEVAEARGEAAEWERAAAALRGGDVRQQLVSNVKRLTVLQVRMARAACAAELAAAGEIEARERLKGVQLEMEEMEDTLRQYHWFLEKSKEEADARAAAAAKELAASVPRKDHVALAESLHETQRKLTENLTDKTQLALAETEAARTRDELERLKKNTEKVDEERAQLAEKCAQLEAFLRELKEGEGGDERVREEMAELRVARALAERRAEMAARERGAAEGVREGAERRLRELEGQVGALAKQLHEAHEESRALRAAAAARDARAAPVEPNLRPRVGELEAEVRKWRASADALSEKLAGRECGDQAAAAERDQLRAAVRELGQGSDSKAEAAKLHEKVARARAKEIALARQLARAETAAGRARSEVLLLRQQLDEKEARLCASESEARAAHAEQQRALRRLESALACQARAPLFPPKISDPQRSSIDGQKAAAWSAELLKLAADRKALSQAATCLKGELRALQDALAAAQGELARVKNVERVLSASAPEVYRQNVELGERELQLKLGVGRLERALAAEKERVGQLERAGAESEQRIAALEESALRERARLEDARNGAQRRAELAERELLALRKERDALDVRLRMERSVRKAAPSAAKVAIHGEDTALLHRQLQELAETAEAHRKASSEHLETATRLKYERDELERQLREARAAAAEKRAELRAVQQERDALLAKLHDRLTSAVTSAAAAGDAAEAREGRAAEQVANIAQATINRLQGLVSEKETAITALREALGEARRKMLEQQERDRTEIGRLNEALFVRNEKSIQDMRTALHDLGKRMPAAGGGGGRFAELTFEELKRFASEKEEQIEALQQGLREWEARYKDTEARLTHERDARAAECARLEQEIQVERARAPSKLMESLVAKLKAQLGAKESKLAHMRDAIKQLDARLVGALQANADAILAQSGGRASEQLGAAELRGRLRELGERMERMQEEVLRCRAVEQERTAECQALKEEIFKEKEAGRRLTNELHRTKPSGEAAGAQTSKPSEADAVAELKEKVRILAVQNKRLQGQLADARKSLSDGPGKHADAQQENSDGRKTYPDASGKHLDAREKGPDARPANTDAQPSRSDHRKGLRESGPLSTTRRPASAKAAISKESTGTDTGADPKGTGGIPGTARTKRASSDGWPEGGEGTRRGLGGFGATGRVGFGERDRGLGGLGVTEGTGHEDKENAGSSAPTKDQGGETQASTGALAAWEEHKRTVRRLDSLRAKVAQSKKDLDGAEAKLRGAQERIAQLEAERDKYRDKVRALEAARRDADGRGPRLGDAAKIRGLTEGLEEVERENERLRKTVFVEKEREITELRRRLERNDGGTGKIPESLTPGGAQRGGIGRGGSPRFEAPNESGAATLQHLEECKKALLEKDNANLELRFEKEKSLLQLARVQRRLKLLFDEEMAPPGNSPSGTPRGGATVRGKTTPRKEQEMEGVIEALKKVAEKLRAENEALRKASHSNVKYMEMVNKGREMGKRVRELEAELETARRNSDGELLKKTSKLEDSQATLRADLRKTKDENQSLKLALEEARAARARAERELAAAAAAARAPAVPEEEYAELARTCGEREEEIGRLRAELRERSTAEEELALQLAAAEDELDLLHGQRAVRNAVGLEQLAAELTKLRGHVASLEAEREESLLEAAERDTGGTDGANGMPERDPSGMGTEARRLAEENRRLRAELASYSPAFFQEVEELKADHHELIKLCDRYEALLHDHARKTGSVFTPGNVD
ncbi:hypothetical protein KFL_000600110 [Klebsormidium nitens]|uniref:Uncharacterized protein n=1 Tax=Klebsormidium nitens TaxID=105231 RepID=A0A1Y1HPY5_KLENI|nr:hypothetical protein KFL_000600110 [Klebsormidium nitens]|eukprot:GAQ80694.1 hypothetical protein KFL_000600110 [Klebsormidium nitens]